MRKCMICLAIVVVMVASSAHVRGRVVKQHTNDLWDVRQGSVVTAHSGIAGWVANNQIEKIFGVGGDQHGGPAETYMRDDKPAGFLHWIEWETPEPITLRSFTLMAAHDWTRDARARGFSHFVLYAADMDTGAFKQLFELYPSNPYATTPSPPNGIIEPNPGGNAGLDLAANVEPTTAQRFRAEFVQWGDAFPAAHGPRIIELDGFDVPYQAIPEPSCLLLLGMGAIGLLACVLKERGRRAVLAGGRQK